METSPARTKHSWSVFSVTKILFPCCSSTPQSLAFPLILSFIVQKLCSCSNIAQWLSSARYSDPCALWSSIFLDRSPRSMASSILHLLSSSLFGTRLALARAAASRVRSSPRFSSIDLQVVWSTVFRDCFRRRSSLSDLTIVRATASGARSAPRYS